jgi:hypothetical protein
MRKSTSELGFIFLAAVSKLAATVATVASAVLLELKRTITGSPPNRRNLGRPRRLAAKHILPAEETERRNRDPAWLVRRGGGWHGERSRKCRQGNDQDRGYAMQLPSEYHVPRPGSSQSPSMFKHQGCPSVATLLTIALRARPPAATTRRKIDFGAGTVRA